MGERILPSPELLRQLLRYEPDTGKLYWKARPRGMFERERLWKAWNTKNAGNEAFTFSRNGYLIGCLLGKAYKAHRVVWAILHDEWPATYIDHLNRNRSDNRPCNLRLANSLQNARNASRRVDNPSGYKGVTFDSRSGKWRARINTGRKCEFLGYFTDRDAAHDAYASAAHRYHKEFASP
jgi:hypothetical protein